MVLVSRNIRYIRNYGYSRGFFGVARRYLILTSLNNRYKLDLQLWNSSNN